MEKQKAVRDLYYCLLVLLEFSLLNCKKSRPIKEISFF